MSQTCITCKDLHFIALLSHKTNKSKYKFKLNSNSREHYIYNALQILCYLLHVPSSNTSSTKVNYINFSGVRLVKMTRESHDFIFGSDVLFWSLWQLFKKTNLFSRLFLHTLHYSVSKGEGEVESWLVWLQVSWNKAIFSPEFRNWVGWLCWSLIPPSSSLHTGIW